MKSDSKRDARNAMNRRQWLSTGAAAAFGGVLGTSQPAARAETESGASGFRFCLNTGTIRGHKQPIDREVEIAAQAGYQAIEPWLDNLQRYLQSGGSLKDLRKRLDDGGLTVEGAIGFISWAVDDDSQRATAFEQAKRDMDVLAQLGARRLAAPPAGLQQRMETERIAERYRQLLELGDRTGVTPILEFWGKHPAIGKLCTAVSIAVESGHPKACVLADVFHMYRGGSPFEGLRLLSAQAMPVLHMNDYPANPPRDQANDGHRVFPGDGVGPLPEILRMCLAGGARPILSLELFNQEYYKQEVMEVAKTGLRKLKAVAAKALA